MLPVLDHFYILVPGNKYSVSGNTSGELVIYGTDLLPYILRPAVSESFLAWGKYLSGDLQVMQSKLKF